MKLPSSIRILGRWIKIIYKPEITEGKYELHGYYSAAKKTIYIAEDQTEEEMMVTLIHEIGHCLVDLTYHSETFTRKQEETLCRIIENYSEFFYLKPNSPNIRYRKANGKENCS